MSTELDTIEGRNPLSGGQFPGPCKGVSTLDARRGGVEYE